MKYKGETHSKDASPCKLQYDLPKPENQKWQRKQQGVAYIVEDTNWLPDSKEIYCVVYLKYTEFAYKEQRGG